MSKHLPPSLLVGLIAILFATATNTSLAAISNETEVVFGHPPICEIRPKVEYTPSANGIPRSQNDLSIQDSLSVDVMGVDPDGAGAIKSFNSVFYVKWGAIPIDQNNPDTLIISTALIDKFGHTDSNGEKFGGYIGNGSGRPISSGNLLIGPFGKSDLGQVINNHIIVRCNPFLFGGTPDKGQVVYWSTASKVVVDGQTHYIDNPLGPVRKPSIEILPLIDKGNYINIIPVDFMGKPYKFDDKDEVLKLGGEITLGLYNVSGTMVGEVPFYGEWSGTGAGLAYFYSTKSFLYDSIHEQDLSAGRLVLIAKYIEKNGREITSKPLPFEINKKFNVVSKHSSLRQPLARYYFSKDIVNIDFNPIGLDGEPIKNLSPDLQLFIRLPGGQVQSSYNVRNNITTSIPALILFRFGLKNVSIEQPKSYTNLFRPFLYSFANQNSNMIAIGNRFKLNKTDYDKKIHSACGTENLPTLELLSNIVGKITDSNLNSTNWWVADRFPDGKTYSININTGEKRVEEGTQNILNLVCLKIY